MAGASVLSHVQDCENKGKCTKAKTTARSLVLEWVCRDLSLACFSQALCYHTLFFEFRTVLMGADVRR